jgi:hypothetical protein
MELLDAVLRADNTTHGALKYMYDYVSPLGYEPGYLKAHEQDLPVLEKIEQAFAKGVMPWELDGRFGAPTHLELGEELVLEGDV